MALALFYHLTRSPAERTVSMLLTRAAEQGWPVLLRAPDPGRLDWWDQKLWLDPEDGFLPHGLAGGPHDAQQPVLLGTGAAANGARALMLIEGAATDPAEAAAMERVWVVFDGADAAALDWARGLWRQLTGGGIAAQYWAEDGGRWAMKRERRPG